MCKQNSIVFQWNNCCLYLTGDVNTDSRLKEPGEIKASSSSVNRKSITCTSSHYIHMLKCHLHIFPFPVPSITSSEPSSDIATPLAGLLVLQDIQLGFIVALMPFINKSDISWVFWVLQLLHVVFGFPLVLFLTRGLTSRILEKFYRFVYLSNSSVGCCI